MSGVIVTREIVMSALFRIKVELDTEEGMENDERADTLTGAVMLASMLLMCDAENMLAELDAMIMEYNKQGQRH